jgi:hypothetical protein
LFSPLSAAFVVLATAVVVILAQPVQEAPLIPPTGPSEALPSSITDYSPTQLAQYQITDTLEEMSVAEPAVSEALPASINDYTPAQRTQYQYTELPEPLVIPVTGKVETLPDSIADYTPAQRAQYQITDPLP